MPGLLYSRIAGFVWFIKDQSLCRIGVTADLSGHHFNFDQF